MAHIIVLESLSEDIFVCGECKSVFNSLTVFIDHKRQSCISNVLLASLSKEPVRFEEHTNLHPENPISVYSTSSVPSKELTKNGQLLKCKSCIKTFKQMKSLLTHMKTHGEKLHQCFICGRCFAQNSHLQRHIDSHKVWPEGISETTPKSAYVDLSSYSCSYCNIVLTNYRQFRVHLKTHLSLKRFKCVQSQCTYFCDSADSLLKHVAQIHTSPSYTCHVCSGSFSSLESIAKHQQLHVDQKDSVKYESCIKHHKCTFCDAMFKSPEKLSLHMATESHNKTCVHCNKTFVSDKRLRMHLKIHGKLKPFKCNICNSSFLLKKYLLTHMLRHGKKQFKCAICKNMFRRQDLLQRHMRLHQTKKFPCPFKDTLDCQKTFSRNDKLQLHVNSKHNVSQKILEQSLVLDRNISNETTKVQSAATNIT